MDDGQLRNFVADSLALWRVAGTVEAGEGTVVALVRAADGAIVWIERPSGEAPPCRWLVRWRAAGEASGGPRETRPRACASLVGMLGAVRGALGVNRGSAVRIAPAPGA
ncbi:MAG TPA: hypothetical protein VFC14_13205 [Burkholderiales bacterium]|nr:hypothetical protein [Burkholderiales bacterium]